MLRHPPAPSPKSITVKNIWLNTTVYDNTIYGTPLQPVIKVEFTEPVKASTVSAAVKLTNISGTEVGIMATLQNHDSVLLVQPASFIKLFGKIQF